MGLGDYISNMTLKVNYDGSLAEQGLSKLAGLAGGLITIYAMKQLADYSVGLAKIGAQANTTERNFSKMVGSLGGNSEKMIADMKRVTMNTIDSTELQAMAYKGLISKINFKDQLVAMEYASKYALSTGANFQDVYDQIMTSFMRNTDRGLKTFGINVAGSKNVVKDAVDMMQKKMGDFSVSMDDPLLKAQQLETSLSDQKETVGKMLVPAYSKFLSFLTDDAIPVLDVVIAKVEDIFFPRNKVQKEFTANEPIRLLQQIIDLKKDLDIATKSGETSFASFDRDGRMAQHTIAGARAELELLKKDLTAAQIKAGMKPTFGETEGKADNTSNFKPQLTTEEINAAREEQKKLNKIRSDGEEQSQKDFIEINKTTLEASAQTTDKKIDLLYKEYLANYHFLVLMGANKDQLKNLEMKYILDKEEIVNTANSKEKQQWDEQQQWKIKQYTEAQQIVEAAKKENMNQSLDGRLKLLKDQYDMEKGFLEPQGADTSELTKKYERDKTKTYQDEITKRIGYTEEFISVASNLTNGLQTLNDAMTAKQIKNLDKQHLSEKEYAKRKAKIEEESLEKRRMFARAEQIIIIAQTISNVAKGVSSSLTGPPFIKWLDVAATIAAGAVQIATIEAQNFANGRGLVDMLSNGRNADTVNARLGKGEYVMPADKTAANIDELEAMRKGVGTRAGGQQITQNFYSVPLESMIQVQRDIQRKNLATQRI
jgi:hypothetical protein